MIRYTDSNFDTLFTLSKLLDQGEQLSTYGLYYDNKVQSELSLVYLNIAQYQLIPEIKNMVFKKLNATINQVNATQSQAITLSSISKINKLYKWLATYLMMGMPKHMDKGEFLKSIKQLLNENHVSFEKSKLILRLVQSLLNNTEIKVSLDQKTIERARVLLSQSNESKID